jgi:predicted NAD/FAD-binding protein
MPKRDVVWSSWNYLTYSANEDSLLTVTYWMNALQNLPTKKQVFVTLNPHIPPDEKLTYREFTYEHPILDRNAISAQEELWGLQGLKRTWYCGSYFGAGFHEDGLQSGLAVAEQLGGYKRPWTVENESGRITVKALRDQTSCL